MNIQNSQKYSFSGKLNAVQLLGLVLLAGFITYVAALTYIGLNVYKDTVEPSDVIIVLGAKSYKDGVYNPCLVARVDHAIDLYKKGVAPMLLMTGGPDAEDSTIEATTMKQIGIEQGADSEDILVEINSTSTYENMTLSEPLLREQGVDSVIVVTEPFHSPRAELVAKKVLGADADSNGKPDIDVHVSPATQSPCWTRWTFLSRYFLREPFALVYYILTGRV